MRLLSWGWCQNIGTLPPQGYTPGQSTILVQKYSPCSLAGPRDRLCIIPRPYQGGMQGPHDRLVNLRTVHWEHHTPPPYLCEWNPGSLVKRNWAPLSNSEKLMERSSGKSICLDTVSVNALLVIHIWV